MVTPDRHRAALLRVAVAPIFDAIATAARDHQVSDDPVTELDPAAPWRALLEAARRRG
jgi:hypothetical protein